jgi:ribose 5-phosphate isomerase B
MRIALASDHAGFELKQGIAAYLRGSGVEYLDLGCHSAEPVDYVDFGIKAMESMAAGDCDRTILFCGTGMGMAIVANKFKGVRAAPCWDRYTAEVSRSHNNSNCLALGGRVLSLAQAVPIVEVWLKTGFEGGRHARRVDKIAELEEKNFKG